MLPGLGGNVPQGLKPRFYAPVAARLKPCPFKARFMQPVLRDVVGASCLYVCACLGVCGVGDLGQQLVGMFFSSFRVCS